MQRIHNYAECVIYNKDSNQAVVSDQLDVETTTSRYTLVRWLGPRKAMGQQVNGKYVDEEAVIGMEAKVQADVVVKMTKSMLTTGTPYLAKAKIKS